MPDKSNALLGLEDRRKRIELVALRETLANERATVAVFIPEDSEDVLLGKIIDYQTEFTASGKPKNQNLLARINGVSQATIRSLWTDGADLFPEPNVQTWWEVWLRKGQAANFRHAAGFADVEVRQGRLAFPEREVVLANATCAQMQRVMDSCDAIAELRKAKDNPGVFLEMPAVEQAEWARELLGRMTGQANGGATAVCILDTGVNNGHMLLAPVLHQSDLHSFDPAWGIHDTSGHGTRMAGLAAYGDLHDILMSQEPISRTHVLESSKILPPNGQNPPHLYGHITETAIAQPELAQPTRKRVFCLAITSNVRDYHGKPSSWSASLDQLCYGGGNLQRAVVVACGNIREDLTTATYLSENDTAEIEDPAQAWNAITVGAFTQKDVILDPLYTGLQPVAPRGDLSPRSRTSVNWERQWPIKPDVVFEGGNYASASATSVMQPLDDLSLITTHRHPGTRHFTDFVDTSAATALAARFFAMLQSEYPDLRPETIRGLMVHSAEWTDAMEAHAPNWTREQRQLILRRYGYGVPNYARASRSARNDATLLVEDSIQPFGRQQPDGRVNEMKLHRLPWPIELLTELGGAEAKLRVTLSYYVEPNPGERGWFKRHDYPSHGLRFAVKSAAESLDEFRHRINAASQTPDGEAPEPHVAGITTPASWRIGEAQRNKGSIHSDYWRGSAADLASRDAIAIYPVGGWWKDASDAGVWSSEARYSLIVSLGLPELDVDIYTPILTAIENVVAAEVDI